MSDISGYRSDGGGLGQDQGLSKQLRGILTAKLPLLSAPGTVLENSLYYDINSSSVTAVEEQATFNKDRIALNNFTFGSTPSAYIPSVLFANTVFWLPVFDEVVVPAAPLAGSVGDYYLNIPEGWGFAAIQNIIVYMGASSIAQIQISGITNLHVNLATCETFTKRNSMLVGAGRYINPHDNRSGIAPFTAAGDSIWRYKTFGSFYANNVAQTVATAPWLKQAVVPLRLPWSSMAILDKRLSMDCKLSTQPIQISLQTLQLSQFVTGSPQVLANFGSQWKSSTIQMWQEELSDKSLSVRNELLAMPEFNVGYPFQYAQSIPFEITSSGLESNDPNSVGPSTLFTMNITSIINSDLTTFLFSVTWNGRDAASPDSGQFCPCYSEELVNIELLLNGQRFFAFDNDDYQFVSMAKQLDYPGYIIQLPSANTVKSVGPSAYTSAVPATCNIYEFNNSRLRAIIAESHMQNTARFTNQTFQLRFNINRTKYYLADPPTSGSAAVAQYNQGVDRKSGFTLNMTYLYNAVYLVGGDGGTTKLITN